MINNHFRVMSDPSLPGWSAKNMSRTPSGNFIDESKWGQKDNLSLEPINRPDKKKGKK